MYKLLSVLLLSLVLTSCYSRVITRVTDENLVIFPAPPDTARIQFLTSISNSIDITGQRSGFMEYILGKDEGMPIIKPYGLSVHKGKIYISDTMLGGLVIIDLNKHTFSYFEPGGRGQLKKPINCFVDDRGYLFVADAERKEVVVFDSNLNYVRSLGNAKTGKPTDVFVSGDKIWICDINAHKVLVYSRDTYELVNSFPDVDPKHENFLSSPTNLFIAGDKVYVSDFGSFKIKVYSTAGEYLRSIGSYGKALGQFVRPKGIAVDRHDNLYVVDAGFENVQIFNKEDKLLMFFGGNYEGRGNMWLPAKVVLDYDNLEYFQQYVHKDFRLKHLIFVTNQYGPDKLNVYGFIELKSTK